jgi:hypothetical protein
MLIETNVVCKQKKNYFEAMLIQMNIRCILPMVYINTRITERVMRASTEASDINGSMQLISPSLING